MKMNVARRDENTIGIRPRETESASLDAVAFKRLAQAALVHQEAAAACPARDEAGTLELFPDRRAVRNRRAREAKAWQKLWGVQTI